MFCGTTCLTHRAGFRLFLASPVGADVLGGPKTVGNRARRSFRHVPVGADAQQVGLWPTSWTVACSRRTRWGTFRVGGICLGFSTCLTHCAGFRLSLLTERKPRQRETSGATPHWVRFANRCGYSEVGLIASFAALGSGEREI